MNAVTITLFVIYLLQSTVNAGVTSQSRQKRQVINTGSLMSNTDAQAVLDHHNYLRGLQNSADMEPMSWNNDLAEMAQIWADFCNFQHPEDSYNVNGSLNLYNDGLSYVGQNLYAKKGNVTLDPLAGTQGWYDEINDYDYATNNCSSVCGHYTQIVWSSSYELGCAVTYCSGGLLESVNTSLWDGSSAFILVCNYGPGGNRNGKLPFAIGAPCTECASESYWCAEDLFCSDQCGSGIPDCSCDANTCQNCGVMDPITCRCSCQFGTSGPKCGTFLPMCPGPDPNIHCSSFGAELCQSSLYYSFMLSNCPDFCGFCNSDPSVPVGCDAV